MSAELNRNYKSISMDGYESPYFIGYTVRDTQEYLIEARFGAISDSSSDRKRVAYVEVRVGDYERDNTLDKEGQSYGEMTLMQADVRLPVDDDMNAIRRALWLLTDQRYKEALTAYHRVKGSRVYREEDSAGAFSKEKPAVYQSEGAMPAFDKSHWETIARELSALLMTGDSVLDGSVEVTVQAEIRYQVNSEGTQLITRKNVVGIHLTATTLAEDGAVLDYGINHYAPSPEQLPSMAVLKQSAVDVREHLTALREAPTLAPLHGASDLDAQSGGRLVP